MISFDFNHASQIKPPGDSDGTVGNDGFWRLPDQNMAAILKEAALFQKNFCQLVVIGIGGSSVGLKCLVNALLPSTQRKVFVLESPEAKRVSAILDVCDPKKTLFNIISKSGETIETWAVWKMIETWLKEKLGKKWIEHVVVTTDPQKGKLRTFVKKEGLKSFEVPPDVGGRFSVLSPVGLFPAACVGVDSKALLHGAKRALENVTSVRRNAALHWEASKKGKNISVMMPYTESLAGFGDWYAQLWAESLGKKGMGQTPVVGVGPMSQHSLLQLLCEGPKDKIVTFIRVESSDTLLLAEQEATAQSLTESGCPNITISLPKLDEENLGALLMTYQIQTAFCGQLMGINPYDQPGVERSKELTRKLLSLE